MLRAKNVEVSKTKTAALISKIIDFLEDPEYMWPIGITFEKGHFFVLISLRKFLKRKSDLFQKLSQKVTYTLGPRENRLFSKSEQRISF